MTDVEMKIEVEDFTDELSDEALDRDGTRYDFACNSCGFCGSSK